MTKKTDKKDAEGVNSGSGHSFIHSFIHTPQADQLNNGTA